MLVSPERGGSNGYPQSMPLYKTSKHRLREHLKTPRRSSRNRCFRIEMKSIHVDLLSTPVSLQYKSRGGGGSGGGLNYTDIFSSRLYSFIFVCFCIVLEHSPFFIIYWFPAY